MNISLPQPLKAWVESQLSRGGYSTASEYVRELLRRERARQQAQADIDARLEAALRSGEPEPIDDKAWDVLRREAQRLARQRTVRGASRPKPRRRAS